MKQPLPFKIFQHGFSFKIILLFWIYIFLPNTGKAQLTLTGTAYSENFNSIGSGLPTGWSVRTGVTAAQLGTAQTFITTQTAWTSITGQFDNAASLNSVVCGASTATQNGSADRAPAIRQTAAFGDPGAAFILQIANTAGKTNFQLSFKLMSTTSGTVNRTVTWQVDYGFGSSPVSFTTAATTPATLTTTDGTCASTSVSINFGGSLDNQTGNVWLRVVTLAASTGSNNRPHTAIDDYNLSWTNTAAPTLLLPAATNITATSADLGATIIDGGTSSLTDRGTVYNTAAGVTIANNPLSEGGTATGAFSHTRSPLSPQTLYYFKGYATNNGSGTALSPESNFYTLSNPPLSEASEFTVTPVSTTQLNLDWTVAGFPATGANANGYIILRRQDGTDPTASGVVNGSAPASLTLPGGTTIVTTITSGAIVTYSDAGLTGGTQYNYIIIPFTWDNTNNGTYNYYLTNAPTANGLTFSSGAAVYFRSAQSGNWNSVTTWQYSNDGNIPWNTPSAAPTRYARGIDILSGHTVTISASAEAALVTVESGATLTYNNGNSLYIADSAGVDLIVIGTFVLNGTTPTFASGVTAEIRSGGIVRADANTGGESDNFPQYTSVLFKTGSLMQWNTTLVFGTSNATYFQGTGYASEYPVFRITQNVGLVGSSTATTFNGKFEATGAITFQNSGAKNFRDGFGGTGGVITHSSTSGPFQITGAGAVIDGTVTLNFDNNSGTGINELVIPSGADVTVSGTPVINIGTASATGANMLVSGTITLSGATTIDLSYGSLTLNGSIGVSSAGSFTANATNTTIIIGGTGNSSAGILKLTSGFSTVNTFTMNRGSSSSGGNIIMGTALSAKNFILTRGVIATGNNLVTWLNDGGVLTGPANSIPWTSGTGNLYSNSFIATCNQSGVAITPSPPFDGTQGFRINNIGGGTDVYFPVGHTYTKTPNRMLINNSGTGSDITVVMGTGDLLNTPLSRVSRIWYVHSSISSGITANVKLFFTERDPGTFPGTQDEVETGFDFTNIRLIQKNYSNTFLNLSEVSTTDQQSFPYATYAETEVYAEYNRGISHDWQNNTNGIIQFTRFSIVNDLGGIVLPVNIINLKAYRPEPGNIIKIDWTSLNEINIKHYEVERSANGIQFTTIGKSGALNNGQPRIDYSYSDAFPLAVNNYYRIKAIDKTGKATYTNIVSVPSNNMVPVIVVYPNPIRDRTATIQFINIQEGNYEFILYDNSGSRVWQRRTEHPGGYASYVIQLTPGIAKGNYYLIIGNGKGRITKKLIVE